MALTASSTIQVAKLDEHSVEPSETCSCASGPQTCFTRSKSPQVLRSPINLTRRTFSSGPPSAAAAAMRRNKVGTHWMMVSRRLRISSTSASAPRARAGSTCSWAPASKAPRPLRIVPMVPA